MVLARVLCGIVGVGILTAGATLWQLVRGSRARWLIAALAAYGSIAFLHATLTGITIRVLLGGHGLFQPVPYVLQGAFVGAFVVLPLGWIVAVVRAGIPPLREGSPRRAIYQAVALTTCLGVVGASTPQSRDHGSDAHGKMAQSPASGQTAITLGDVVRAVERTSARIHAVDWDLDARADALGPGLAPTFEFVRDRIRYEAYAGVLRGASGTYTERAGNAADRALLLAHLLERHGFPVRFAIGHLAGPDRTRLWLRVFEPRPRSRYSSPAADHTQPGDRGLDQLILARTEHDYAAVRHAIGDRLRPVTKPTREQVLSEMDPHVWVEARVDDRWIDLDPSFADAVLGNASATLERTVEQLPEDMFQRTRLLVVAEYLTQAGTASSTLLDVTRKTVDLVDKQVFLFHQPGFGGSPLNGMASAFTATITGHRSTVWTPTLWINGRMESGHQLDLEPASSKFVSERLQIELTWPHGRQETTDRVLATRTTASPIGGQSLSPSTLHSLDGDDAGPFAMQAVHNVWFSGGRHQLADYAAAIEDFIEKGVAAMVSDRGDQTRRADDAGSESASRGDLSEQLWPIALNSASWMVWTDHAVLPRLNDTPEMRLYVDGPRIAILTAAPSENGTKTMVSDLRRDDLRALSIDTQRGLALAEKKLWFGIAEGALEREALAAVAESNGGDPSRVESTSSHVTDRGLRVIQPGAEPPPGAGPAAAAALMTALRAGRLVVVPDGGLKEDGAWWEIADGSGDTRAVALGLHGGWVNINPLTAHGLRQLPRVRTYQGSGVASVDVEKYAKTANMNLRDRNMAARLAEARAKGGANSFKPPPRYGSNEESTLLSTVALAAVGIIVNVMTLFAAVYDLYMAVGLFLEGPG
jgi:transglutaminase-like putative cysteine protease